jgi:hypothetical protein
VPTRYTRIRVGTGAHPTVSVMIKKREARGFPFSVIDAAIGLLASIDLDQRLVNRRRRLFAGAAYRCGRRRLGSSFLGRAQFCRIGCGQRQASGAEQFVQVGNRSQRSSCWRWLGSLRPNLLSLHWSSYSWYRSSLCRYSLHSNYFGLHWCSSLRWSSFGRDRGRFRFHRSDFGFRRSCFGYGRSSHRLGRCSFNPGSNWCGRCLDRCRLGSLFSSGTGRGDRRGGREQRWLCLRIGRSDRCAGREHRRLRLRLSRGRRRL